MDATVSGLDGTAFSSTRFFQGQAFLHHAPSGWPADDLQTRDLLANDKEAKAGGINVLVEAQDTKSGEINLVQLPYLPNEDYLKVQKALYNVEEQKGCQ